MEPETDTPAGEEASADKPAHREETSRLVAECIEAIEQGDADPVARVCAGAPDLMPTVRRRLERLAARGLLETRQSAPALPATIGPYRIVRELGRGGMGSVYLAEQEHPVRRQVALKVIKPGMDTREVVARFEAERQALAMMNHPHIAKVHDAGATPDGRPFFVMELVEGEPITTWCELRKLDVAARAALLARVCRAVQHAHDRGVIHRDLKPSNILVVEHGGEPVPKVIDFGVAKATGPSLTQATLHTRLGQMLGTPEYMSPEQACSGGVDVDTRTDVYSLGVILYELLCNRLPFESERLRRASAVELERILVHETPRPPSARCHERDVQRNVRGELDWICLRALEKERERRYPSPLALAEDVERHLRHETVLAGPPTASYRLRKLIRRHRVEFAALAAVLLALVAGLIVSLSLLYDVRAAQEREQAAHGGTREFYGFARQAVDNMLVRVGQEQLRNVPQAAGLRRELLEDALRFYERMLDRRVDDPLLRLEIARAHDFVGKIRIELGQPEAAAGSFRSGAALASELLREPAVGRQARLLRAEATKHLGTAHRVLGRPADARESWLAALADLDHLRASPEGAIKGQAAIEAVLRNDLAVFEAGEPGAIVAKVRRVIELFDVAIAEAPEQTELRMQREHSRRYLAQQTEAAGDAAAGEAMLRAVIAEFEKLGKEPGLEVRGELAEAHDALARLAERAGRIEEAEAQQQEALRRWRELVAARPEAPDHRAGLADGLAHLASCLDRRGLKSAALKASREEVAHCSDIVKMSPQTASYPIRLLRARLNLGSRLIESRGEAAVVEGERVLRTLVEEGDALLAARPDDAEVLPALGTGLTSLGTLLDVTDRDSEALAAFDRARDLLGRAIAKGDGGELRYLLAFACHNGAWVHQRRDRLAEAELLLAQGFEHLKLALRDPLQATKARALLPRIAARLGKTRIALDNPDGAAAAAADVLALAAGSALAVRAGCLLIVESAQAGARESPEQARKALPQLEQVLRDMEDAGAAAEARADVAAEIAALRRLL